MWVALMERITADCTLVTSKLLIWVFFPSIDYISMFRRLNDILQSFCLKEILLFLKKKKSPISQIREPSSFPSQDTAVTSKPGDQFHSRMCNAFLPLLALTKQP